MAEGREERAPERKTLFDMKGSALNVLQTTAKQGTEVDTMTFVVICRTLGPTPLHGGHKSFFSLSLVHSTSSLVYRRYVPPQHLEKSIISPLQCYLLYFILYTGLGPHDA